MSSRKLAAAFFGCAVLTVAAPAFASGYSSLNAGIAAENEGRYSDAVTLLTTAIASPDLPPALQPLARLDRARAYASASRLADAVADCDAALHLKTGWYSAYVTCGVIHGESGNRPGAATDFSAAIALRPDLPRTYILRAVSYTRQERYDDAIADDGKAIALDPDDPEGYFARASVYETQENFALALADWTKGAELEPDNFRAAREIGVVQWALGDLTDAQSAFERARRLAPQSLYAQIWIDIVEAAKTPGGKPEALSLSDAQLAAWPGPLLKFYGGSAQLSDVMVAANAASPPKNTGQVCEADFYIGEWEKLHGAPDAGKAHFDDAVKICPHDFIEYRTAAFELRQTHKQGP